MVACTKTQRNILGCWLQFQLRWSQVTSCVGSFILQSVVVMFSNVYAVTVKAMIRFVIFEHPKTLAGDTQQIMDFSTHTASYSSISKFLINNWWNVIFTQVWPVKTGLWSVSWKAKWIVFDHFSLCNLTVSTDSSSGKPEENVSGEKTFFFLTVNSNLQYVSVFFFFLIQDKVLTIKVSSCLPFQTFVKHLSCTALGLHLFQQ